MSEERMSSKELRRHLQELEGYELSRKKRISPSFRGFSNGSFFSFQQFWSDSLLRLIYLLGFLTLNGMAAMTAYGVLWQVPEIGFDISFADSFLPAFASGGGQLLLVICGTLVLNVLWRLLCEAGMIIFRIYAVLHDLSNRLEELTHKVDRLRSID